MIEHYAGHCWFPLPWSQLHKETLLNSLPWCSVLSFTISELGIHHPARSLMPASPPDSPATHHPPSRTIQESGHPSDFSSSHPLQSANISSQVCHSFHPSPTQYHLRPRFCGNLPNESMTLINPLQSIPQHLSSNLGKSPISANPSALPIGFEIKLNSVVRVRVRVRVRG